MSKILIKISDTTELIPEGQGKKKYWAKVEVTINILEHRKMVILNQTIYFEETMVMNDTILIMKK